MSEKEKPYLLLCSRWHERTRLFHVHMAECTKCHRAVAMDAGNARKNVEPICIECARIVHRNEGLDFKGAMVNGKNYSDFFSAWSAIEQLIRRN